MNKSLFKKCLEYLSDGRLDELEASLDSLPPNDSDVRYLKTRFSTSEFEDGTKFDKWIVEELRALAKELHPQSMLDLAWRHKHGDEVAKDEVRFRTMLTASALLGNKTALCDLVEQIELDLDCEDFSNNVLLK